jgi:hypothetical protein
MTGKKLETIAEEHIYVGEDMKSLFHKMNSGEGMFSWNQ